MAEIDIVGLYLVVFVLICGTLALFKFALNISKLSRDMDNQREWGAWAERHQGHQFPAVPYPHILTDLEEPIEYCGPGDFDESYHFTGDEAYNYVLDCVIECDKGIENLEHSVINDLQGMDTWQWCDAHLERDYWMRQLKEFEV